MIQLTIIEKLPLIFQNTMGVNTGLLIGSFARNNPTYKSDIDISLWVEKDRFKPDQLADLLENQLDNVIKVIVVQQKDRLAVYFRNAPRLEIVWFYKISDLDRNYLGSEIPMDKIKQTILFAQKQHFSTIFHHLEEITKQKAVQRKTGRDEAYIRDLCNKFILNFENASHAHYRSDSYKSYFFYNIALQAAVELNHIAMGYHEHNYLPRNFAHCYESSSDTEFFRSLAGSLYLPEVNQKKQSLIEFFSRAIERFSFYTETEIVETKSFLGFVFNRDFIWNFRDVASICKAIKPGKVYRASSLTRYQDEPFFESFINAHSITTVIDLRDDDEYALNPYNAKAVQCFRHIRLPIDPRQQSYEFRKKYHYGTPQQIAYRHFAEGHKHIFRQLFEQIDPQKENILVHCHAGKDRTGSLVVLILLLLGEQYDTALQDYFASEMDTKEENLLAFLEIVNMYGGVKEFLLECGISHERICYWKQQLSGAHCHTLPQKLKLTDNII